MRDGIPPHLTMTPWQQSMPKDIQREAYERIPTTCDELRSILNNAQQLIITEYNILPEDIVGLDIVLSAAHQAIKDNITQKFRDEQMALLYKLKEKQ